MTTAGEPLTCTLQEAAALIGVSRSTVDRLLSRRSVVAFIDGPTNAAGPRGGGSRPGQLASLPAVAGGGLVVFENNTAPGRNPGRQ